MCAKLVGVENKKTNGDDDPCIWTSVVTKDLVDWTNQVPSHVDNKKTQHADKEVGVGVSQGHVTCWETMSNFR